LELKDQDGRIEMAGAELIKKSCQGTCEFVLARLHGELLQAGDLEIDRN